MADSGGGNSHLVDFVDDVLERGDVCRAFDQAPHVPHAGDSVGSMFNAKAQVDLLFLDDLLASHAMDMFSKIALLPPAPSENPQDVWDAVCGGRLGAFGPPKCSQMDEGGEWKNEIRTDWRAGRRI